MNVIEIIYRSIIFICAVYGFRVSIEKFLDFLYEKFVKSKERSKNTDLYMKRVRDNLFDKVEILDEFSYRNENDIYLMQMRLKKTDTIIKIELDYTLCILYIPGYDMFTETEKSILTEKATEIISKNKDKEEKRKIEIERQRVKDLRKKYLED